MTINRRTAILAAISALAGVVAPKLAGAAPKTAPPKSVELGKILEVTYENFTIIGQVIDYQVSNDGMLERHTITLKVDEQKRYYKEKKLERMKEIWATVGTHEILMCECMQTISIDIQCSPFLRRSWGKLLYGAVAKPG